MPHAPPHDHSMLWEMRPASAEEFAMAREQREWHAPTQRLAAAAAVALMGGWLAGIGPAGAAPLVYESFAYDADTQLDETPATGQNLTGDYAALGTLPQQVLVVTSPGLDYGSLVGAPTASGNAIVDADPGTAAGATVSVDQDVVVGSGGAIYWSALFTFDDSLNANHLASITLRDDATGDQLVFGEPVVGSGAIRVEANTGATGGLVSDGADNSFIDGHTLLLIGRYLDSPALDGDILQLIGYDTADAVVLPSSFDPTDPNLEFAYELAGLDIDFAQITSISFTIRGANNNFIDELRIGSTWADVIPEPATASLLALGLVAMGVGARAGRRG